VGELAWGLVNGGLTASLLSTLTSLKMGAFGPFGQILDVLVKHRTKLSAEFPISLPFFTF
jgi:hypothetical protein